MGHGHDTFHKMMARQVNGRDVTTINGQVVSVVYVTESPTFDGVIGGYSTVTGGGANGVDLGAPTSVANSISAAPSAANTIPAAATASVLPSASASSSRSFQATASVPDNTAVSGPAVTSSSGSSSTSSSSSSSSDGMSTGAKAGLAIGILAGVGLIAALLLFCIGKKKKQRKEQEARAAEDEKKTFGASRNAIGLQSSPSISSGPAPRLSIRPMSKNLLGDFGFGASNRRSGGNLLNTATETPPRGASPAPQSRAQTPPDNPFADPQNPFADPEKGMGISGAPGPLPRNAPPSGPALRHPAPVAGPPPMALPPAPNADRIAFTGSWPVAPAGYDAQNAPREMPIPSQDGMSTLTRGPASQPDDLPIMGAPTPQVSMPSPKIGSGNGPEGMMAAGAAGAVAGAAVAAVSSNKQERRQEPTRPEPQQMPREEPRQQPSERREVPREAPREAIPSSGPAPSPALTAAASDVPSSPAPSAAGGQAPAGGNVYRVLMDFVPSMDDELELKSGTLVRLLHEYDDGWVSFAST
jgi:hypothetical protein